MPQDFEERRDEYYQALQQPRDVEQFIEKVQNQMRFWLERLDRGMPKNHAVQISSKKGGSIHLTPFTPLPEPPLLATLKGALLERWSVISLLDMLKETDLRIGVTSEFHTSTVRVHLDRATLQKRLLLCFYGLGTNAGLKRVCAGAQGEQYKDLAYVGSLPSSC